jgi:3-oxoacyl-[acyl-carrier-protein] synthase III
MDNAWIFNLSGNHCANIDYALTIASEIAGNNPRINNILILGNVKINDPAERLIGTYGLLSDGSGAMLLNKQVSGWSLKQSRILSAGRLHHVDLNRDDSLLLCKYYVRCMQELLQQAGLQPEQVAHVITQNANPLLVTQCMESIGISNNKLFTENSSRYAHMDCVDFLVNLKDLTGNLQQSTDKGNILTFGTGWAGSFISSLIHYQ